MNGNFYVGSDNAVESAVNPMRNKDDVHSPWCSKKDLLLTGKVYPPSSSMILDRC